MICLDVGIYLSQKIRKLEVSADVAIKTLHDARTACQCWFNVMSEITQCALFVNDLSASFHCLE